MNHLLESLQKTIEELQSLPYITVNQADINGPANASAISELEQSVNIHLPQNIRDFYLAANGLTCTWRLAPGAPADIRSRATKDVDDLSGVLGAIRVFPVETMLKNKYWELPFQDEGGAEPFNFGDQQFTLGSFARKLKLFDCYDIDQDFECMALVTGIGKTAQDFYLLMLDNHFADWHNSRLVNFETYIQAMCTTRFLVPSRRKLFAKYRGDREPVITDLQQIETGIIPSLFGK